MAEENENHNAKETMNVQELLNTMVASQIQLREDMNAIVQQFQSLKHGHEEEKVNQPALMT